MKSFYFVFSWVSWYLVLIKYFRHFVKFLCDFKNTFPISFSVPILIIQFTNVFFCLRLVFFRSTFKLLLLSITLALLTVVFCNVLSYGFGDILVDCLKMMQYPVYFSRISQCSFIKFFYIFGLACLAFFSLVGVYYLPEKFTTISVLPPQTLILIWALGSLWWLPTECLSHTVTS